MWKPQAIKGQPTRGWLSLYTFIKRIPYKSAIGLALLGLAGLIYCSVLMLAPAKIELDASAAKVVEATTIAPVMNRAEPTRLVIERIGVNAPVINLGLDKNGAMQTPGNGTDTGWYINSPTPGELGPAVIAAHVDTKAGQAVFARLNKLQAGDKITVQRTDGTTAEFVVNSVKQYPQSDSPTEEIYGNTGHAAIRLITCGGTFDRNSKRYSHNTVVFGTLVN